MLRWLIGFIYGEIICESSNWQYMQRLKITILGANWQLFRLERIDKCSYLFCPKQNIKFYRFVMKTKKFLLPIWWYNRGLFPLGNKYFWVFVLKWVKRNICTWIWIGQHQACSIMLYWMKARETWCLCKSKQINTIFSALKDIYSCPSIHFMIQIISISRGEYRQLLNKEQRQESRDYSLSFRGPNTIQRFRIQKQQRQYIMGRQILQQVWWQMSFLILSVPKGGGGGGLFQWFVLWY